jgi:hypothetical protein
MYSNLQLEIFSMFQNCFCSLYSEFCSYNTQVTRTKQTDTLRCLSLYEKILLDNGTLQPSTIL